MRSNVRLVVLTAALAATALFTLAVRAGGQKGTVVTGPNRVGPAAGFEILMKGGNAFDAGVAAMLAGGVVEQDLYSLGGEGLVLVYPRSAGKVTAVVGQGWAPKGATI